MPASEIEAETLDGPSSPLYHSVRTKTTQWWEYVAVAFAVVLCIAGQSVQNVYLPIVLSEGFDFGPVMVYTAVFYFVFFSILDVIMDVAVFLLRPEVGDHGPITELRSVTQPVRFVLLGLLFSLNGIGALFGGSPDRTPLTVQMAIALLISCAAPFYRTIRHRGFGEVRAVIHRLTWGARICYLLCLVMYVTAAALVVSDQIAHLGNGTWSPFVMLFAAGIVCGLLFNAEQDLTFANSTIVGIKWRRTPKEAVQIVPLKKSTELPLVLLFKREVTFVRSVTTWQFATSWIAIGLSAAGWGGAPMSREGFYDAWAAFLPLGNRSMNLFNLGQITTLLACVYINRYTSALTLLVGNVAAVTAMFAGFSPSIQMQTVGFEPSIPKTVVAAILAFTAVFPSMLFSKAYRDAQDDEEIAAESSRYLNGDKYAQYDEPQDHHQGEEGKPNNSAA